MAGGDDDRGRGARRVGRYALLDEIARGGMATVNLGRLVGPAGFSRIVAIKRLHPHLSHDDEFAAMLVDEARLVSRIQHPNVVSVLDVVQGDGELALVMDYVVGETLFGILRAERKRGVRVPPAIAAAVVVDVLRGLDAAHDAKSARGEPLHLIHRDVTPHNIMVRADGTSVIVDFGVAKAAGRLHTTEEGKIKGKLPYMAPEQVRSRPLSRRVDVYAAGAVLWEALVGKRFVGGDSEAQVLERLLYAEHVAPSAAAPGVLDALDAIVLRAVSPDPDERYASAGEMAEAIEGALTPARPSQVAAWLQEVAGSTLAARAARVAALEVEDADLALDATPAPASRERDLDATVSEKANAQTPTSQEGASSGAIAVRASTDRPVSWRRAAIGLALLAVLPIAWFAGRAFASNPEKPAASVTSADPVADRVATAAPVATASVAATAVASAPAVAESAAPSATGKAAKTAPRAGPARPGPKRRCAEVTIDAAGNKHFHPECMHDG